MEEGGSGSPLGGWRIGSRLRAQLLGAGNLGVPSKFSSFCKAPQPAGGLG